MFILPYYARSIFSPHLPRRQPAWTVLGTILAARSLIHLTHPGCIYPGISPSPASPLSDNATPPSHLLFIPSSHCPHARIVCVVSLPTSLRLYTVQRVRAMPHARLGSVLSDNQECVMPSCSGYFWRSVETTSPPAADTMSCWVSFCKRRCDFVLQRTPVLGSSAATCGEWAVESVECGRASRVRVRCVSAGVSATLPRFASRGSGDRRVGLLRTNTQRAACTLAFNLIQLALGLCLQPSLLYRLR